MRSRVPLSRTADMPSIQSLMCASGIEKEQWTCSLGSFSIQNGFFTGVFAPDVVKNISVYQNLPF
jgi:hypothetical protein